jgi:hypothetical protein
MDLLLFYAPWLLVILMCMWVFALQCRCDRLLRDRKKAQEVARALADRVTVQSELLSRRAERVNA